REREPEVAAGDREALEHPLVALLGTAHELPRKAVGAAARAELDPGAARDRLLAGERLETSGRAALARRPVGVDGHVAELGAESVRSAEELAVDEDSAADPDFAEDADEVLEVARSPLPMLGERGEVRLVVGADGKPRQARPDLVRDGDVGPTEIGRPEE